jgi:hypothetical protein
VSLLLSKQLKLHKQLKRKKNGSRKGEKVTFSNKIWHDSIYHKVIGSIIVSGFNFHFHYDAYNNLQTKMDSSIQCKD